MTGNLTYFSKGSDISFGFFFFKEVCRITIKNQRSSKSSLYPIICRIKLEIQIEK